MLIATHEAETLLSPQLCSYDQNSPCSPFLKWAGGKRWLIQSMPELFSIQFNTYIEPFLGGGAVFFHVRPVKAILADINPRLIETYQAIRNEWPLVKRYLQEHQHNHSSAHYYSVRSQNLRSNATRAAQFIYLNRTCWNGLYRLNQRGEFNVPIGTKSKVLSKEDDFALVSARLKQAELMDSDFEKIIARADEADFLFVDPPYTAKHKQNGFIKYNEHLFSWSDQLRLRDSLVAASARGAKILATNADHPTIVDLYSKQFSITQVERSSVISGKNHGRGAYGEVLITNYK